MYFTLCCVAYFFLCSSVLSPYRRPKLGPILLFHLGLKLNCHTHPLACLQLFRLLNYYQPDTDICHLPVLAANRPLVWWSHCHPAAILSHSWGMNRFLADEQVPGGRASFWWMSKFLTTSKFLMDKQVPVTSQTIDEPSYWRTKLFTSQAVDEPNRGWTKLLWAMLWLKVCEA